MAARPESGAIYRSDNGKETRRKEGNAVNVCHLVDVSVNYSQPGRKLFKLKNKHVYKEEIC